MRIRFPSSLSATDVSGIRPPALNVWRGLAVSGSQRIAVPSSDPVSARLPSPLNATETTWSVCPLRVWIGLAVSASQRIAVLSSDPVRTRLPSPLSATELI